MFVVCVVSILSNTDDNLVIFLGEEGGGEHFLLSHSTIKNKMFRPALHEELSSVKAFLCTGSLC